MAIMEAFERYLPESVSAVNGLHLRRGVPPRIHEKDVVCNSEVQGHSASLE
jgi:hypothetical protein